MNGINLFGPSLAEKVSRCCALSSHQAGLSLTFRDNKVGQDAQSAAASIGESYPRAGGELRNLVESND